MANNYCEKRDTLQNFWNSKSSPEFFEKKGFDLGSSLQVLPKSWPRLVRLVFRLAQYLIRKKDLELDFPTICL